MTHTTNFNLSQWAKTDRIQMADFNADNAKLDAALANRNVQLYTTTYVGMGSGQRSLTFPHKPMIVFVMRNNDAHLMTGVQGASCFLMNTSGNSYKIDAAWSGNTVTWQNYAGGASYSANGTNITYTILALLDANE